MKKAIIIIVLIGVFIVCIMVFTGFIDFKSKGKMKIAAITNENIEFFSELDNNGLFTYQNENNKSYMYDNETGRMVGYSVSIEENKDCTPIDNETAKKLAYEDAVKLCKSFFDYDYEIEVINENDFCKRFRICIYQLSEKKNRTGNNISIRMNADGNIYSMRIHDTEDPTTIDNNYKISKQQAIEIAYQNLDAEVVKVRAELKRQRNEGQNLVKPTSNKTIYNDQGEVISYPEDDTIKYTPYEADINDRSKHKVYVKYGVHKGKKIWYIDIKNVPNNLQELTGQENPSSSFGFMIDADTGEVLKQYIANIID